jgi:hypothetical protein
MSIKTPAVTNPDPPKDVSSDEEHVKEMAKLSQGAYGSKDVEGWTKDPKHSSRDRTLYYRDHPDGKRESVMALRGTDLTRNSRGKDLGADALVFAGLQSYGARFRGAEKAAKSALKDHPDLKTTGHSLGGSVSLHLNHKLGLGAETFNAGVSPFDIKHGGIGPEHILNLMKPKPNIKPNARLHVIRKDVIGGIAPFIKGLNVNIHKQKHRNPHSLKNFL